jgi:hypothetical protein
MTRNQPVTASWLWSQHNEHRIPLARLLMFGVYRFKSDFRVPMFVNVLLMAALSAFLIRCAQQIRGRPFFADIFMPLVLLGFAHGLNFIWGWQLEFFASTALAGCVLLIIARASQKVNTRRAGAVAVCLLLLGISGAHGLAVVPFLGLWLVALALAAGREQRPDAKRRSLLILLFCVLVAVEFVLYFVGYERVPYHPTSPGIRHTLKTGTEFLTMAFGTAVRFFWPASGILLIGTLGVTVLVLVHAAWKQPGERLRAFGFACFLASISTLGIAVGLGRDGFEPRYISLSVPILCCVYLVLTAYLPRTAGAWACALLLGAAAVLFWPNTRTGIQYAQKLHANLVSFERQMKNGVPPYLLIHEFHESLHPHQQLLSDYFPLLRTARIGAFGFLKENPDFREFAVPFHPAVVEDADWQEPIAYTRSSSGSIEFQIPTAPYAAGIRIRFSTRNADGTLPYFSLRWRSDPQSPYNDERYSKYTPTGDRANWLRGSWVRLGDADTDLTVWVCERVSGIRIVPDLKPSEFRVAYLTLLLPPNRD